MIKWKIFILAMFLIAATPPFIRQVDAQACCWQPVDGDDTHPK